MTDVSIRNRVWNRLVAYADQHGIDPQSLAEQAVNEFVDRRADEELFAASSKAAGKSGASVRSAEQAIKLRRSRVDQ